MGRILSAIEQNVGYVADVNSLSSLQSRLDLAKNEIKNADTNAVATVTNQYIRDLVTGMVKDYNDPRFQPCNYRIYSKLSREECILAILYAFFAKTSSHGFLS